MKKAPASEPGTPALIVHEIIFPAAAGLFLALALIKFGNPVIFQSRIEVPQNLLDAVYTPWPVRWAYWLLAGLAVCSLAAWRWQTRAPLWLISLPVVWFLWQLLSAVQTVEPRLTKATLTHFGACVVSFYLGLFALSRVRRLRLFWLGLLGGFLIVIAVGWQQHFGGLAETRRYFYQLPDWQDYPPEFIKKLGSDRIYGTLFYPNTLAGVIILLLPLLLAASWLATPSLGVRISAATLAGLAGLACLFWSGSKAGWLIVLAMSSIAFLHLPLRQRSKQWMAGMLVALGLCAFAARYANYFSRGATSVSARWDYCRVALQLVKMRPFLGSGPGTFSEGYRRLKTPDAEMTRLAHNDYLQQGTDSGVMGLLLYSAFWICAIGWLYRRSKGNPTAFAVWLGIAGLAVQSLVEFGLYIPATAWSQFMLAGWLLGSRSMEIEKQDNSKTCALNGDSVPHDH